MIEKVFNFKKGNRGQKWKVCKLALRYLVSLFWLHLVYNGWLDSSQKRDSKCLRINFSLISLFNDHWAPSLTCFHTFWSLTCLHTIHFWSLFPFFKLNFFCHLASLLIFLWPHSGQHVWVVMFLKPSNMTYTYDNSGHGNDNGNVNYVADNKMP